MAELAGVGRYERHGRGRPVVVLGNPQADPGWWAPPFVSGLAGTGYEVITFVHTGPSWAPSGVARDVAAFAEQVSAEPVRLLGWSQGAAIAQEMTLLRPDLVAAAALIAPYGRQNTMGQLLQDAWLALGAASQDLDPVRLAMLLLASYPPQQLGDDSFLDPLLDGVRRWSARQARHPQARERSAEFIAAYQDRLAALAAITVPCLVVGFTEDADTFVARAREVALAIPASRYLEFPGAGHLTPVTDPHRVIEPVLRFFTEVDGQGRN